MHLYLPIAELSVNVFSIIALGGLTGILSGLFGVGGGFLTTPFLIFMGISPAVAVASSANQIVGSSMSGFLSQWRRGHVDIKLGLVLVAGGLVGSTFGVSLFTWLRGLGLIDVVISILYVIMLTSIGSFMAWESWRKVLQKKELDSQPQTSRLRAALRSLPFITHFPQSKIRISLLLPLGLGVFAGMLVALMGIGGGFFLLPAMIYILGMSTTTVVGTSLFQMLCLTAHVTFMHAMRSHTVDLILAILLLIGGVFGAQIGARIGAVTKPLHLRAALAALVLLVAIKLGYQLFLPPASLYDIVVQ